VLHQIIRSWYSGRRWVGCYIWYSEEGPGRAAAPPSPLLAVPTVTAQPSTASVPITALLLHNCPLLCGFNVARLKGKYLNTFLFEIRISPKPTQLVVLISPAKAESCDQSVRFVRQSFVCSFCHTFCVCAALLQK